METVVSGIRSTGNLHLGNYFGAIHNFIKLQETHHCFFFIADYHSLTTHPTANDLHNHVGNVLVEYLAVGLDPEKATLFIQSDLPEVTELYLFLNMNAYLGELQRSTSFKDKIRSQPDNINAGLLTYPTLMAADILLHKATQVPVGKDQEQHLEMTRNFAGRFNRLYKVDYFPEPTAFNFGENLIKVPGLDGKGKMSKSDGEASTIFLRDEPEIIRKKIKKAVSDSGNRNTGGKKSLAVKNLFDLLALVSPIETIKFFEQEYKKGSIRYGDLKHQIAEDMILFLGPIQEKIKDYSSKPTFVREVARLGAAKARISGQKTIREVREIIGFKSF
jgi:tryptophanyl-tRNA synthetase